MSVLDNVRVGAHARHGEERAEDILYYVNLYSFRHRAAPTLPYGTQKRVEVARALASGPRLLLLDEPAGGLNHEEVDAARGRSSGRCATTRAAPFCSSSITWASSWESPTASHVLDFGRKIAEGTPAEVRGRTRA